MRVARSCWLRHRNGLHYDFSMRFAAILALALSAGCGIASAQTRAAKKADSDRHGLTCAQILGMPSTEWVAKYKEKDASAEASIRALAAYGQCYDARTNRLAALLAKTRKGPLIGARGNFRDFEKALDDFTSKALGTRNPSKSAETTAYAALYAEQFRYKFYRSYETREFHVEPTPEDLDALGFAKNHFGELLNALPEDKMRGVHAAFGHIFEGNPLAEEWRLEIYRYAISLLEPPSPTPFAPPPF